MIKIIPIQQEFRQPLPVIYGNVDYIEFRNTLERISEIIELVETKLKSLMITPSLFKFLYDSGIGGR